MNMYSQNKQLVSIIIPSYNYGEYISKAIESVINQTYNNWELIIIDDGSNDNSLAIIKNFCKIDTRIKYFFHENHKNKGLAETLKRGIKEAKGEYIAFLEADDFYKNDCIEKKINLFQKDNNLGLVYSDVEMFGSLNIIKVREKYINKIRNFWRNKSLNFISDILYFYSIIPTFSCVMIKKELLIECNFSTPRASYLDFWLWSQIIPKISVEYINEKLTFWNIHENSFVTKEKFTMETYYSIKNFRQEQKKFLPPIKSLKYCFLYNVKIFLRYIKYDLLLKNIEFIKRKLYE